MYNVKALRINYLQENFILMFVKNISNLNFTTLIPSSQPLNLLKMLMELSCMA